MAATEVFFYQDDDQHVPVLEWLIELQKKNQRAAKKCFALVKLLCEFGRELRRPHADYLRDGVYELRTKVGHVNYRILYGFVGKDIALLTSGLTKEQTVPSKAIDEAVVRIASYNQNPARHRYEYQE